MNETLTLRKQRLRNIGASYYFLVPKSLIEGGVLDSEALYLVTLKKEDDDETTRPSDGACTGCADAEEE